MSSHSEFTTLCPKTGQPDFGHIYITYIPRRMVESKSLGDFHEDCVNIIMKDLTGSWIRNISRCVAYLCLAVGISIYPFANMGDADHQGLCEGADSR